MRNVQTPTATQEWPWRQGPSAVLASFRRRWYDTRFWVIQGMVIAVTAIHYTVEAFPVDDSISTVHHIPVILYLIPVVYASLHYGWEGGVLTAVWAGLLTVPSMAISHRSDFHWAGELGQVAVTLLVGAVLAWRVKLEAEQRQRAERTSIELAVSEEKYRSIFESAGDPILVCDGGGRITAANDAAALMSGYSCAEVLGMPVERLFGAEGRQLLVDTSQHEPDDRLRLVFTRKDGSTALVDAARTALGGDSEGRATQVVLRDVTEQERLHEEMRTYIREVTRAQEEERTRIARELHDDTAQSLVLLCRGLDVAARGGAPSEKLEEMRSQAESLLENVRRFSRDLRPSILDDLGLLPAIEWVAAEMTGRGAASASVKVEGTPRRLSTEAEIVLFRIAQEALRNVEKHAGPCSASVEVNFGPKEVTLTITDDGRGFEPPEQGARLARLGKLGLLGMQERAELLGAEFAIESRPGRGTSVRVRLPTGDGNDLSEAG
ncbi:MAG: PAS domain S-box protein [Chloroflexi bacterium]|nr:PAS domain S-box protein [Chloroflexota bacterium]